MPSVFSKLGHLLHLGAVQQVAPLIDLHKGADDIDADDGLAPNPQDGDFSPGDQLPQRVPANAGTVGGLVYRHAEFPSGSPVPLHAGLGSIQRSENVRLDGGDRSQLVHAGVQRDAVVVESAPILFGVVVVTVRPDLPAEKFFLTGKVLAGQPDMYAGDAPAYDSVLVKLVQSKIALGIKHNFLHFICRGLRAKN